MAGRLASDDTAEDGGALARRPTIKDVAHHAGVSFKTVSRVMNRDRRVNEAMREAVEAAMAALGYRPHRAARSLRTSRTYAIALLAGSRDEPTSGERTQFPEYLGEVVAGCTRACRPAGFHLVLELLTYGDRKRAAAVASALLDDLATRERSGALRLRRDHLASLADTADEREDEREPVHALQDTPSG